MRTLSAALSILALLVTASVGAAEIAWTSDAAPPILDRVELPEEVGALTVSADGEVLAYAVALGGPKGLSELTRTAGKAPESAKVRGTVRDLLFLSDGRLLALVFRPAKKWEGDTYLLSWAPGTPKPERLMRVPPSSSDLDHWPARGGIVIACRNEIRTLIEPELRSGPVFMVPGSNLALTTLGGSSFVWVGQEERLLLVDLAAPSGREPMRALAQQPVPAPVAELADYPDGSAALVRLADDRLFRATLEPPGFKPGGSADRIVRLAKGTGGPPIASAPHPPAPAETEAEPVVAEARPEKATPPPVIVEPRQEQVREQPAPAPERRPEPAVEEPVEAEEPAPARNFRLYGKITGNVGLVQEVVLLGPDNILEEAVRVKPDDKGNWGVERLLPGRYRVQVDGGGDRVLVADPRLVLIEVGDEPTAAPEIRILRAF